MSKTISSASNFMSLLLRHKPETIGLQLDESGWANIEELIRLSQSSGKQLSHNIIKKVVDTNDKQRFSISECGRFVRANQGHSIAVDLQLTPTQPPEELYHGTATRFADSIFKQGLKKNGRQHVHLTAKEATAVNVGSRHGKPLVLLVDADRMHTEGYLFYLSKNGVWLTDHVPSSFLK